MSLKILIFIILDILVLVLSGQATLALRYGYPINDLIFDVHLKPFLLLMPFWLLFFYIEGLYTLRNQSLSKMSSSLVRAIIFSSLFSVVYFYIFSHFQITPKTNIFIFAISAFSLLWTFRFLFLKLLNLNAFTERVVLIGSENLCTDIENKISKNQFLGIKVIDSIVVKNKLAAVIEKLNLKKIDQIIIESSYVDEGGVVNALYRAFPNNVKIINIIEFMEKISGEVYVENLESSWVIENFNTKRSRAYRALKACFDKLCAMIIFIVFLPLFLLVLLVLLIVSGRPLFFTQTRTGYLNKPFTLIKLRTMSIDAEIDGIKWAQKNDSRVTPVGRFLRKSRLDELPQVINVLLGHMSLVGPRPERPEIIEKLAKEIPFYKERHLVKPGLTGWAQVNFGYASSQEDTVKKLKYDLYYIKYKSLILDLKVLLKTVKIVFLGMGR